MMQADYRMRDLAPRVSEYYRRADQRIAVLTAHAEGNELLASTRLVNQQERVPWINQYLDYQPGDLRSFAEREQAWRDTGVAPGISHPELVKEIAAVLDAVKNAKPASDLPKPPKDWGQPGKPAETASGEAGAANETPGATPGPQTEQGTPGRSERPTLEQAYPDLDMTTLLPEERAELQGALDGQTRAEQLSLVFDEAAMCLKAAGA